MAFELVILSNIVFNEEYTRKVMPFLKEDYFTDQNEKLVFNLIDEYVKTYNTFPSIEALAINLTNKDNINENTFNNAKEIISSLSCDEKTNNDWLIDQTEHFCQEKAIYNAIRSSIQIIDDKSGKTSKGSIPQILSDALAVSFDTHIGHDFIDDADERYEYYHKKEIRVPFDLEYFNKITKGGLPKKTLNIVLAGVGVGKSLFMCHNAASNLEHGLNVLYITLEMAEAEISKRIDANLLDIPINELMTLPKLMYDAKIEKLKRKTQGKLIVKEYPTSCAGASHFRHLLNELKLKKNFIPDIIYIDYLNICSSSRVKMGASVNSYTYIKAITEELRGLAVEFNVPICTATQLTRSGFTSSDVGLEDTAESFATPACADMMFAIINSDELQALNQLMIKQLKNRYSDLNFDKRFVIGIDRSKMRLYDAEQSAQNITDGPVMDKSAFNDDQPEWNSKPKFDKSKYKGFK